MLEYLKDSNATQAAIRAGYSRKTAQQIGSRLLLNVVIASAIAAHGQQVARRAGLTIESHLAMLNQLREQASNANQYSAAVTAEVNRGKASGFYVEQHEHKHKGAVQVTVRIQREGKRMTNS